VNLTERVPLHALRHLFEIFEFSCCNSGWLVGWLVAVALNASLTPRDYSVTSATRACAKTWLGNTCRRDWLGKPEITCITTCDRDFCNCDARSPPTDMFRDGRVLPLAPERSTYSDLDMLSCRHMDVLPGSHLPRGRS